MNREAAITAKTIAFRAACRDMCAPVTGDGLVGRNVAARLLGVAPGTMKKTTWKSTGPAYVRRGKPAFYAIDELARWAVDNSVDGEFLGDCW